MNQAVADDEFESFDVRIDTDKNMHSQNSKTLINNPSGNEYNKMGKNTATSPMFDQRMSVEFINNEGNNIFVNSINTIDQPQHHSNHFRGEYEHDGDNIDIENYLNQRVGFDPTLANKKDSDPNQPRNSDFYIIKNDSKN